MSVGYGGDPWNWGSDENYGQESQQNTDSNNCWLQPNLVTQNFNYQHSKEAQHGKQDRSINQSGKDYFDSVGLYAHQNPPQNYAQPNSWTYQHHTENVPQPLPTGLSYERVNNNTSSEVENREIAPPDNKISKNGSGGLQGGQDVFDHNQGHQTQSNHLMLKPTMAAHNNSHFASSMFLPPSSSSPLGTNAHTGQLFYSNTDRNSVPPNPFLPAPPLPHSEQPTSLPAFASGPLFNDSRSSQRPPSSPSPHRNSLPYPPQPPPLSNPEPQTNVQRFSPTPPKPRTPPVSNNVSTSLSNSKSNPFPPPAQIPPYHAPDLENIAVSVAQSQNFNQNVQNSEPLQRSGSPFFVGQPKLGTPTPSNHNIPENQERIPENRERLDNPEDLEQQLSSLRINQQESETQQHCSVDRNQYLETGQLSSLSSNPPLEVASNIEITDEGEAPPPGLHRLVTGQGCENREHLVETVLEPMSNIIVGSHIPHHESSRHSTPASSIGEPDIRRVTSETEGEPEIVARRQDLPRLVPGQSIGDDASGVREVPGEAEPVQGRVVLGRMGRIESAIVPDPPLSRGESVRDRDRDRERDRDERIQRMVPGEIRSNKKPQSQGGTSDEFRQQHRGRHRHRRDSSFEEEERDYSSDRERRHEDYRRRDDRQRRRREHRSPEYRSDDEYEDRRGYSQNSRDGRSRRHRRYDGYNREYDDEYYYRESRSRPSSRTGSDYRRCNIDYQSRQPSRHYMHDPNVSGGPYRDYEHSMKEYFETMRRTDPVAYTMWYNQYMSRRSMQQSATYSNDRASVHSGQSSSNQRRNVHTPHDTVDDGIPQGDDSLTNEDFTPRLYSTAHVRGSFDSHGRLIIVDAHYPVDGQRPSVQLCRLIQTSFDPDIKEFLESPGPFIPGVTHRNTVLQYLKRMSDRAISSSEKLLYDLIHLTVKTNGVVNGSDVAELLMESYKKSSYDDKERNESISGPEISQFEVIARFRELLQQGNKTEALEWAMEHRAWGHALFLASKMDDRTHNNVMLRFANSLPHNDPLQTLYQLMSGHVPQASTCCADKKWSDWRPHLAMILSNPTGNPNLDRKAIITLGDSLGARGRLFASHFCYVTAQVEFSPYQPDAKLVLLGSSSNQEFSKFATCRSIMLSMCYEYGLKLHRSTFSISTLQIYKLLLATHLIDHSKNQIALQYCELLANEVEEGGLYDRAVTSNLIELATRLKMFDPTLSLSGDTEKEPNWLTKVRHVYESSPEDYDPSSLIRGISTSTLSEAGQEPMKDNNFQAIEQPGSMPYIEQQAHTYPMIDVTTNQFGLGQQPSLLPQSDSFHTEDHTQFQPMNYIHPQPPQQEINGYQSDLYRIEASGTNDKYWENGTLSNLETQKMAEHPQPTAKPGFSFYKTSEEQLKPKETVKDEPKQKEARKTDKGKAKTEEQHSGWFGGIWEKLALRPKNQMRLPDDSNPSIVWDEERKRWVNLDGDDEDKAELKPPPRVTELSSGQSMPGGQPPPQISQQGVNKYKLQKGKLMKSNYVDVMGGGPRTNPGSAPKDFEGLLPTMAAPPVNTHLFVPAPVEGNENAPVDFITPANQVPGDSLQDANKEIKQHVPVPSMYNPANFAT